MKTVNLFASILFASAVIAADLAAETATPVMPRFRWNFTFENPVCISFGFETGDLEKDGLSTRRLVGDHSASVVTHPVRHGRYASKFVLRPGDRVSDGWRAELRDLNNAVPGATVWYSLSTWIPESFPNETDNSYVLMQWHDQKVPWNNPKGHSPPMAMRYRNGRLDVTVRHAFENQKDGENGREITIFSHHDLERGVWHDFIFKVKWSAEPVDKDTGHVRIWMNGEPRSNYRGPVGYFDDLGVYVKFGIYARHDVQEPHVVYHDAYHRGLSYQTVCVECNLDIATPSDIPDCPAETKK